MRAKKPLKLTAGKFYVMSMEAFFSVREYNDRHYCLAKLNILAFILTPPE